MHMFDAESRVLQDLKEESEILGEHAGHGFTVVTARHPTLGKLVFVTAADGNGVVVEADE